MEEKKTLSQLEAGYYVIELINAAFTGRKPAPKPESVSWEEIYQMAMWHSVDYMVYVSASQAAGPEAASLLQKWQVRGLQYVAQGSVQLEERKKLREAYREAGIRMLPLKGWFLKEFYPVADWRQMADLDLLIDEKNAEKVCEVMRSLGYQVKYFDTSHHDIYEKPPWLTIEVHRELFEEKKKKRKYEDIWERSVELEEGYFRMNWEDYYLYLLEHLAKHYYSTGSGIRSVLDIYVFLQNKGDELDRDTLNRKLKEHHLQEFAKIMEEIARGWFEKQSYGQTHVEDEEKLILSGVYGTYEQWRETDMQQRFAKYRFKPIVLLSKLWSMAFPGFRRMCSYYPQLKKRPLLLPYYWFHRIFVKRRFRVRQEIDALKTFFKKKV